MVYPRTAMVPALFRKTSAPVIGLLLPLILFFAGCAGNPSPVATSGFASLPSVTTPAQPKTTLPDIAGPEEGFVLAMEAFKVGDQETAGLFAESVMERYPDTAWSRRSLFLLGRTLAARDRTSDAEAVLLRIPSEYPVVADYALFILAEHYAAKQRYGDAVGLYQRLINPYPSSPLVPKALFRKAQALYDAGSFGDSAAAFERALSDFPRSEQAPDAGLGLGRALAEAGDLPGSVRAFLDVTIRYPAVDRDGEVEKYLDALKARGAEVTRLTPGQYYDRAKNQFKARQYERAYDSFRAALDADPAHPQKADILLQSGIALYNIGRRPEAASMLERLLKADLSDCRCAEALNWLGKSYSRLGLREEAVESFLRLARTYPESDWADDALYLAGNVYRDAGDMKMAVKYYRRLATEYPESSFADSALWWEGWAAYSSGDLKRSVQTLQEIVRRYPRSWLVNQALYWQGRAAEKEGDVVRARRQYRSILSRGPYTYYGHRAAERLSGLELPVMVVADEPVVNPADPEENGQIPEGGQDLSDSEADGPPVWTEEAIAALSSHPAYRKCLELMYLGMKKEASIELWSLRDVMPARYGALLGVSKAFFELGDYYSSLVVVLRGFDRHLERPSSRFPEDLWLLAYPQGFWQSIVAVATKYGIDPYFVAAIIREESQFRPEAVSPAGARGVMQVMPATGEWVARTTGLAGFDRSRLFEADVNITVGTWYLAHLMKRFQGDLYRVSAAYNAGPEAVSAWNARNGGSGDIDEFVESIPYLETRGYVKKVIRNYAEYRRLYGRNGAAPVSPLSRPAEGRAPADGVAVCRAMGSCP